MDETFVPRYFPNSLYNCHVTAIVGRPPHAVYVHQCSWSEDLLLLRRSDGKLAFSAGRDRIFATLFNRVYVLRIMFMSHSLHHNIFSHHHEVLCGCIISCIFASSLAFLLLSPIIWYIVGVVFVYCTQLTYICEIIERTSFLSTTQLVMFGGKKMSPHSSVSNID